ncbi:flavin-containing amine oxidasedehydrogenase [Podospora fimiseda]|uniref:Flavin-containing amine oxidasedehydrogenase n=1 Tax=Podospora fimiseda TaxID=252190 RepID=A0AAN7BNA4_9PEZI|nr:flavin-containing amine oxidasedehydrogenase [Podospora fimiseda]
MGGPQKKRVLVVGAGAAGMSCAHHLAQHPEKFDVTLIEATNYCGGQAFSIAIDKDKHGASWLNQGVQGGSYIFHHTMTMFARQGFAANSVKLQVSFGKGAQFWTNVYPTKLLERHQTEIKRFVKMLSIIRWFEIIFALLPIKLLMKLFWFSYEFANTVALPMVALFLGTGNYTPDVPAIILERLCTSPTYGMWYPPDKKSIANNLPPMVVFPNFSKFYETWHQDLVSKGIKVRLSTELTQIITRGKQGVIVKTIKRSPSDKHNPSSAWAPEDPTLNSDASAKEETEHYDEIVLCCQTDTSLRLLGKTSSFLERKILSSVKFSNDITITHTDASYMRKHYEPFFNPLQAASSLDTDSRITHAKTNFNPMYFIKPYPSDLTKLEMCFDCTNYQAQFPPDIPFENHVFQTIFLNKERDGHLWTDKEIDPQKIIRKDWWHQLCHSWTHYAFVVPWVWLLQGGRKHTRFAGSWTVINAHEVAVMSGIAAAVDLGADYPQDLEKESGWALLCFRLYYLLVYGKWYRKRVDKGGKGMGEWESGLYGSLYKGPGVVEEERRMWRDEQEVEWKLRKRNWGMDEPRL